MKDNLEDFIRDNRDSFNSEEPSADLWAKIEQGIDEKPQGSSGGMSIVWKVAAAIILLVGLGWPLLKPINSVDPIEPIADNDTPVVEDSLPALPPEVAEAEAYYAMQVNEKIDEVKTIQASMEDTTTTQMLFEEIQALDEDYKELRKEMGNAVNDEKIIEAMISNYRLKLQILEDILEELKESTKTVKDDETVTA